MLAAILYFAPHYLEGLAEHWELLLFIIGVILVLVEIFAIPGFGVTGISGIILIVAGLTLAMIDNELFKGTGSFPIIAIVKPFGVVVAAVFLGLTGGILLSKKLLTSSMFPNLALHSELSGKDGFVGVDLNIKSKVGMEGVAITVLRPSGKVQIDTEWFDAMAEFGYIEKGEKVKVVKDEAGQLYVVKID